MMKESREFMKTIKDFLDFTNLSKEWKSALLVLVVSSLLYSSFYTLVMRILFMMNNSRFVLHGIVFDRSLFWCCLYDDSNEFF